MPVVDDEILQQAYGRQQGGVDFFRDGFATVAKGDLPSGISHGDPRMNATLADMKHIMKGW